MPIYDYACARCGHLVEVVHGVHAHGPSSCPACGGPMRKLLSTPAIHFRGSGWAKKDARDSARRSPGKTGKSAEPASAGAPEGGSSGAAGEADGAGERSSAGPGRGEP